MNAGQFDDLTRALAVSGSRRHFLLRAAGAATAGFLGPFDWRVLLRGQVRPPCRSDADCGPCEQCLTTTGLCQNSCGASIDFQCCPGRGPRGYRCAYIRTEEENCGGCGRACGPGEACCRATCRNLQLHPEHCGACDKNCGAGETCCEGKCLSDKKRCGDICIPAGDTCCITESGQAHGCGPNDTCCYSSDGWTGTCAEPGELCCPDGCSNRLEREDVGAWFQCCLPTGGFVACWKADGLCDCGDGLVCCPNQPMCIPRSDYQTDRNNCGGCGCQCKSCETCLNGKCVCEGPRCGNACCCEQQTCLEEACCEPCGTICCAGDGPTPKCCNGKCQRATESCCPERTVPGCRPGHCCETGEECCPRSLTGCVPVGSPCPPIEERLRGPEPPPGTMTCPQKPVRYGRGLGRVTCPPR